MSSYRLGYWLILVKLVDEALYQKIANGYVESNDKSIQYFWGQNIDITKLKEFLDTYTVGSLA